MTCWHVCILACWHADMLTCWHIDMLTYWHADLLTCWHNDMLICWHAVMLTCWHADMLKCWHIDMLTYWYADMLTCWHNGSWQLNEKQLNMTEKWYNVCQMIGMIPKINTFTSFSFLFISFYWHIPGLSNLRSKQLISFTHWNSFIGETNYIIFSHSSHSRLIHIILESLEWGSNWRMRK